MNGQLIAVILAALAGSGGLAASIVAFLRLKPERESFTITAAQGVVVMQTGVIDRLEKEQARLGQRLNDLERERAQLVERVELLEVDRERLRDENDRLRRERDELRERVEHLEDQVERLAQNAHLKPE